MNQRILDWPPKRALRYFAAHLEPVIGRERADRVVEQAKATVRYLHASKTEQQAMSPPHPLEARWVASLQAGQPDFDVYADDAYMAEAWACWSEYARLYLRRLIAKDVLPAAADFVVDLGCGFGLSTAVLAQHYPTADVVGTNLPDTPQWDFACRLADVYGFRMAPSTGALGWPADVVFASEYFEHFERPVDHLDEILDDLRPRMLVAANTFTQMSTGHFTAYEVDGETVTGQQAAAAFNQRLRDRGYVKQKVGMWNDRPAVWTLVQS